MSGSMAKAHGLHHGPISTNSTAHICVDMQRMFAEGTAWKTPWMKRVLPKVVDLVRAHADQTIFTRFIPAAHPGDGEGVWSRYWERWAEVTLERLPPGMIDLVPELARFVPPGRVVDKQLYSPWIEADLESELKTRCVDTLVVTGSETDVCVLATVMGAIDRGYRVIVVSDGLCSSSDEAHDAMMTLYHQRYSEQVEVATTDTLLDAWR
jgi:nicotinamidase-related amidase